MAKGVTDDKNNIPCDHIFRTSDYPQPRRDTRDQHVMQPSNAQLQSFQLDDFEFLELLQIPELQDQKHQQQSQQQYGPEGSTINISIDDAEERRQLQHQHHGLLATNVHTGGRGDGCNQQTFGTELLGYGAMFQAGQMDGASGRCNGRVTQGSCMSCP